LTGSAALRHSPLAGEIFASIPDPLERFRRECQANHTECVVTADIAASAAAVSEILASIPPGEIFLQDAPLLRRMAVGWAFVHDVRWSSEGRPNEATKATITLAESLVAATGSVFVSAGCGGRGASIVAPVHIVAATVSQLAPDLATALEWLRARETTIRNSMVSLITGPSRTGDIEKIIVLGAHGPQRLIVVLAMRGE
jgi:L-lactate utilization protein LutC